MKNQLSNCGVKLALLGLVWLCLAFYDYPVTSSACRVVESHQTIYLRDLVDINWLEDLWPWIKGTILLTAGLMFLRSRAKRHISSQSNTQKINQGVESKSWFSKEVQAGIPISNDVTNPWTWITVILFAFTVGTLLSIGVVFTLFALFSYRNTRAFLSRAIFTQGKIVDYQHSLSENQNMYAPIIQFEDQQGNTHIFTSSISSSGGQNSIGKNVGIWYEPNNPQNARIDGLLLLYFTEIVVGLIAVGLLVAGTFG
jgi:Protein of unknown function (DUF3592)